MIDLGGIKCKCGEDATCELHQNLGEAVDYLCEDCLYAALKDSEELMTGDIIEFPGTVKFQDVKTGDLGRWSVRRIALEILVRDDMLENATCALAGAFAAKSIELEDFGMYIMLDSNTKTPVELVKDFAHEIANDPKNTQYDEMTTFFSAVGCFAWDFIDKRCTTGGSEHDVN